MTKVYMLNGPGNPEELVVPVGRVLHVTSPGTTMRDIEAMPYQMGGRAVKPKRAVMMRAPDGVPVFIPGMGAMEAAEIQDLAYAVREKNLRRCARGEPLVNREALGLVPQGQFGAAFGQALEERIHQHKANPRSDPARMPGNQGKRVY